MVGCSDTEASTDATALPLNQLIMPDSSAVIRPSQNTSSVYFHAGAFGHRAALSSEALGHNAQVSNGCNGLCCPDMREYADLGTFCAYILIRDGSAVWLAWVLMMPPIIEGAPRILDPRNPMTRPDAAASEVE